MALLIGSGLAVVAVLVGAMLGYIGPIITLAILGAGCLALWILSSLEVGLFGVISVVALLPFATLPFKFVLTPSLLDLALGGVLIVYLGQWMVGHRRRLTITPAHGPIVAFVALAIFAFVAGLQHTPFTANLIRKFAQFLVSICAALIVVDHVQDRNNLERLVCVILIVGIAAAVLGLVLYLIPADLSERFLNALGRIGYPLGSVLRYIEDNPANAQRAIGTSVDPNSLGGLLAMIGALAAPQLVASKPLLRPRWLTWIAFALIVVTLILSFSRAAMISLGVTILGIALLRYRRLVWLVALGVAIVILMPAALQGYGSHFIDGLHGRDLATQMRFGEYKDALTLLSRYPLIGVGFAATPDVDIYLGVANAYLTIAAEMGFVGLAAFLIVIGVVFGWAYSHSRAALSHPYLGTTWMGVHAGLAAVLVVGMFDHYFVNLDFHSAQTAFWIFVGLALASTRLVSVAKADHGLK